MQRFSVIIGFVLLRAGQVWRKADTPAWLIPALSGSLQWSTQLCFNQSLAPIRLNDSIFYCDFKDELQRQQPLQAIGNSIRPCGHRWGSFQLVRQNLCTRKPKTWFVFWCTFHPHFPGTLFSFYYYFVVCSILPVLIEWLTFGECLLCRHAYKTCLGNLCYGGFLFLSNTVVRFWQSSAPKPFLFDHNGHCHYAFNSL